MIRLSDQSFAAAAHRAAAMNLARMTGVVQVTEAIPIPYNERRGWAVAVDICWPHNAAPMRFWLQAPVAEGDEGEATTDASKAWYTFDRAAAARQCQHLIDETIKLLREEGDGTKVQVAYFPVKAGG